MTFNGSGKPTGIRARYRGKHDVVVRSCVGCGGPVAFDPEHETEVRCGSCRAIARSESLALATDVDTWADPVFDTVMRS